MTVTPIFKSLTSIPSYYHLFIIQSAYNYIEKEGLDMDNETFQSYIEYHANLVIDVLELHDKHNTKLLEGEAKL